MHSSRCDVLRCAFRMDYCNSLLHSAAWRSSWWWSGGRTASSANLFHRGRRRWLLLPSASAPTVDRDIYSEGGRGARRSVPFPFSGEGVSATTATTRSRRQHPPRRRRRRRRFPRPARPADRHPRRLMKFWNLRWRRRQRREGDGTGWEAQRPADRLRRQNDDRSEPAAAADDWGKRSGHWDAKGGVVCGWGWGGPRSSERAIHARTTRRLVARPPGHPPACLVPSESTPTVNRKLPAATNAKSMPESDHEQRRTDMVGGRAHWMLLRRG